MHKIWNHINTKDMEFKLFDFCACEYLKDFCECDYEPARQIEGYYKFFETKDKDKTYNDYVLLVEKNGEKYYCAYAGSKESMISFILFDFQKDNINWKG